MIDDDYYHQNSIFNLFPLVSNYAHLHYYTALATAF